MKKIIIGVVSIVVLLALFTDTVSFMFRECPQKPTQVLEKTARTGSAKDVRFLVKKCYADVDGDWQTPLMSAAGWGNLEVIRELRNLGVFINDKTFSGFTALMNATRAGHAEAIKELIKFGADIEAKDKDRKTAYDYWQEKHKDHPNFQEIADLLRP